MKYDIYGIGNPIIDITIKATDEDLQKLSLDKGTMHLIDENRRSEILHYFSDEKRITYPAGSCPNTIMGAARLGANALLNGKVGIDESGTDYDKKIIEQGVISLIKKQEGTTGTSIILVTPDSQRTMNTFLGNCRKFSKQDIDADKLINSKYLYFTGYMWDTDSQKEACEHAMRLAKENDVEVVFNLADPNLVLRNKEELLKYIPLIDILLCNEEEAFALTGNKDEEAIRMIYKTGQTAIITLGENGSIIMCKEEICRVSAFKVIPIDSTGAGDMFAAGLLFGLTQGYPIQKAATLGSFLASRIVIQNGTKINDSVLNEVKEKIDSLG